jgi:hypothetical protein
MNIPTLSNTTIYTIINIVEEGIETPENTVRDTAQWRVSKEAIQHAAQAESIHPRRGASKKMLNKKTLLGDEVLTLTIANEVWTEVRKIAQRIARASLGAPRTDTSKDTQAKVNSLASKLIVVADDGSATVYNNPEHARRMKEQAR